MSNSNHVVVSFLLLLCFNSSLICADSLSEPNQQPHNSPSVGININILVLEIRNDLPPRSERLQFIGSFQATEYPLEPGQTFTLITNFELKDCQLFWPPFCASVNVYDPKIDSGHNNVFWSIRKDGVYHSWDKTHFDKRSGWKTKC
ncbi:hypothetical protein RIF29_23026 [Crotalaria pallida]|uniref:Leguminosin group486 secreted peptide n=1 Tax=Crotalaria pallida TaxID=3830 RepID=A0AAN9I9Q5_CROPI